MPFFLNKILQENYSLLPEPISATGNQISRRDKSFTNSVLIKLKDNEDGESRVRLSSFNSNISEYNSNLLIYTKLLNYLLIFAQFFLLLSI